MNSIRIAATPGSKKPRLRMLAASAALLAVGGLLSACADSTPPGAAAGAGEGSFKKAAQDEKSPITVWVDANREAAVDAYQAAHPDVKINKVIYGAQPNELKTKVELFNRTGEGWPDVVWPNIADPSWAASGDEPFAAPISELIDQDELDKYAAGSLNLCTYNDKVYCVRNDIAQNVLWYNKKLMDKFGYEVPTTWEEWEQLGLRVAKEHPGYLVGEVGSTSSIYIYQWGSRCPMNTVKDNTLTVDMHDEKCTRIASMTDSLLKAGALGKLNKFDTGFIKESADKILMMPGASWFGSVLFKDAYKTPAGEIAAAPPLKWAGENETYTGSGGGGLWMISSHSKNLKAATDFVTWVTQDPGYTKSAGTYPAYTPASAGWLDAQKAAGYYANDIAPALTKAAAEIWPGWTESAAFSQQDIYGSVVLPKVTAGGTVTDQLDAWQAEIENQAKAVGYKIAE